MAAPLNLDAVSFIEDALEFDLLVLTQQRRLWEAVPIRRRAQGFLLGLPPGVFPASRLRQAQTAGVRSLVGPSTVVSVPLQGAADDEEVTIEVLVVDVSLAMVGHLAIFGAAHQGASITNFHVSGRLPDGAALMDAAAAWVDGDPAQQTWAVEYVSGDEGGGGPPAE